MQIIELLISACLIANPSSCMDVKQVFGPVPENFVLTHVDCQRNGQLEVQKWIKKHPGYQSKKWTCRLVDLSGNSYL